MRSGIERRCGGEEEDDVLKGWSVRDLLEELLRVLMEREPARQEHVIDREQER